MPEKWFTEFSALSDDPKVGICRPAPKTDNWLFCFLYFLSEKSQFYNNISIISFLLRLSLYDANTEHLERKLCLVPMGKTEISSIAKNRTNTFP